jgi:hypothetical protein
MTGTKSTGAFWAGVAGRAASRIGLGAQQVPVQHMEHFVAGQQLPELIHGRGQFVNFG